jgi:uncharacterized membrane protein YgcG
MRASIPMRILAAGALLIGTALSICAQQQQRPPRPKRAQPRDTEQILDFHSDVTLQPDSSLQVAETIAVFAANVQINHGIYRDFPTRYTDHFNNKYVVDFRMLGATCDSAAEQFRVEDVSNGKRIYLGDPATVVQRGRHVYTISYITNRQLGFFKDHDELFWNVTGNGWAFAIQHASATVYLPQSIPTGQVQLSGYTGPQGSLQSDLTSESGDSVFQFSTTRPLRPREGLTILLQLPKGVFAEPTFDQKLHFFFRDNRDALALAVCFLIVLVYYLVAWNAVGRDPERGVVMALYEPPQNLSPAGMRYLQRMGFDNKTFAAAILDMAVRGYLTIKQMAGSYTLFQTGKDTGVLTQEEKQVAETLFAGRDQIWLHNENHVTIRAAMKALKKNLAAAEQKTYFVANSRYLIAPVAFSIAAGIGYLALQGGPKVVMGIFLCFWLTFWSLALSGMVLTAFRTWASALHRQPSALGEVATIGKAIAYTFFTLPFCFGEALGIFFLMKLTSLPMVLFIVCSGVLHLVFFHLMKAPTFAGRRLMDQVEGFKMFLGEVDGDRLNRAMPPEQTPEVFERFLPYALALDVEQAWANKFSGALVAAGAAPSNGADHAYSPSFYSGSSWNGFSESSFASSFSDSFTSAISSSASAPGSGGGGGGSGGGGGGGGGGGW